MSFRDSDGITHAVEVTAASLYEAVVLAVAQFRRAELTGADHTVFNELVVEVRPAATTSHRVRFRHVEEWLRRVGKGPAEEILKIRLREMLK